MQFCPVHGKGKYDFRVVFYSRFLSGPRVERGKKKTSERTSIFHSPKVS